MSQFEGGKIKVRCVDCTKLESGRCTAKGTKVTPKKKRTCNVYEFKGEYENRTPAESTYVPYVNKKTRKMIRRLLEMGVIPVAEDGSVEIKDGFARTKTLPMPATTATATMVGTKDSDDSILYTSADSDPDSKLIWTPGDE